MGGNKGLRSRILVFPAQMWEEGIYGANSGATIGVRCVTHFRVRGRIGHKARVFIKSALRESKSRRDDHATLAQGKVKQ